MSSGIDSKLILAFYQGLSDAQLIQTISQNSGGLIEEAQGIIKAEIARRRLDEKYIRFVEDQQNTFEMPAKVFDFDNCPVDEDARVWIEGAFKRLLTTFGVDATVSRHVLLPERKHFPIRYDGTEQSAFDTLKIITKQMEVPFEKVTLDFYDGNLQKITEGTPGGTYWGIGEGQTFEISLARPKLDKPEDMIAVLAHEVAHIKLLGENRIAENDEPLTDMTTIFFGLGVFGANAAFRTFVDDKYYGWSQAGYLTQMEWGYALALFAHMRKEDEAEWVSYLCKNVRADFIQGLHFIKNHENIISIV